MRRPNNTVPIVVAIVMLIGGSCASRILVGMASYHVEVSDQVVDPFGVVERTLCAGTVTFVGDIDTRCEASPMVWSYAQTAPLDCSYRDGGGMLRFYWDYFDFEPGYIREPACDGSLVRAVTPALSLHDETAQPRDEAQRLVLDESILLGPPQASVRELRDALRARRGEPQESLDLTEHVAGARRVGEVTLEPRE